MSLFDSVLKEINKSILDKWGILDFKKHSKVSVNSLIKMMRCNLSETCSGLKFITCLCNIQ